MDVVNYDAFMIKCQSHYYQAFFSGKGGQKCEDKLGCLNGRLIVKEHFKQLTLDSEIEYCLYVCLQYVCVCVCVLGFMLYIQIATTFIPWTVLCYSEIRCK